MSHYWKFVFGWILSAVVSVTLVLSQFPVISFADVPDTQKAVSHSGPFGSTLDIPFIGLDKYFTIQDPTGIPSSEDGYPNFFYTKDNKEFFILNKKNVLLTTLSLGCNIVLDPSIVDDYVTDFMQFALSFVSTGDNKAENGVYDGSGNLIGYALNDITGCYYYNVSTEIQVDIPSDFVNNVYNIYQYRLGEDPDDPDFVVVVPPNDNYISSLFGSTSSMLRCKYNFETLKNTYDNIGYLPVTFYNGVPGMNYNVSYMNVWGFDTDSVYFLNDDSSTSYKWSILNDHFGLNKQNYVLSYDKYLAGYTSVSTAAVKALQFHPYNKSDDVQNTNIGYLTNLASSTTPPSYSSSTSSIITTLGYSTYNNYPCLSTYQGDPFTIYKDYSIYKSVVIDHDYTPPSFHGTKYYDYSINNDNGIVVTNSQLENSIINNGDLYQDCTIIFNDNSNDNPQIPIQDITTEITITIENKYPDTPDNPDNPDNPDDPSGGGSDDPDIDNETVLDAILEALGRFFKAIGKILAAILAGLLEVVDSVLEAIAGLMENFTGITDFLKALFSWLPSPIPEVIAAGVSICILFAVFRFIRG